VSDALITGIDGFAGRHLAAYLQRRGDRVSGIVRRAERRTSLADIGIDGAAIAVADVTDADAVAQAVAAMRPAVCFHLAAIAYLPAAETDPGAALRVNALGTLNLLAAIQRHVPACRVVVVGSADAYGAPEALPIRERAPLQPRSAYGASKAAAEVVAAQWARNGLDVVRVRPFNHTGPGQRPDFVCADVARQLAAIARGAQPPRVAVGDLTPVRDFTDVRDVVAAYAAVAARGTSGAVYNVCSGVGRTIRSVLDDLIAAAGVEVEVEVRQDRLRPSQVPALIGSPDAVRTDTGWQPHIAWSQTVDDLLREAAVRLMV
jgi:GDP-4-dehydro-6-deoxy-D-mannose reductase